MKKMNFLTAKNSVLAFCFLTFLISIFTLNIYGASGVLNLLGYGSSGDYSNPVTTLSGSVHTLSGETTTQATQITTTKAISLSDGSANAVIPNGVIIVTQGGTKFNSETIGTKQISDLPLPISTTEKDIGKISFGVSGVKLNFSKPVKLQIPVSTSSSQTYIKVKHAGESSYDVSSLTDNFAATCSNGVASPSTNLASVSNGIATIYTCSASDFIAVENRLAVNGGGGGGTSFSKDYCPNGDFSPSYYDKDCGTAPKVTSLNENTGSLINTITSGRQEIETVPNTTIREKIRFKFVVDSKVQTINYRGFEIKNIAGYELSQKIVGLQKGIILKKGITEANKKKYVDTLNKYLVAKYTYDLSREKTDVLRNAYIVQMFAIREMMKEINK